MLKTDALSTNDQGFYNQPVNSYNVQESVHIEQNSNLNASVNMEAYFSDNIFQPDHSNGNSSLASNLEPSTYTQADSNIQNVNKIDNLKSDINEMNSSENNLYPNQNVFHQDFNNTNPSHDANKNSISPSNENITTVNNTGNGMVSAKDTGNTNYNILSVFTDSSTSSHTSSTHTGPFLLNEESLQQVNNEASSQPADDKSGNVSRENNESYHLFEQTHNENYFGINFGNDEGKGSNL